MGTAAIASDLYNRLLPMHRLLLALFALAAVAAADAQTTTGRLDASDGRDTLTGRLQDYHFVQLEPGDELTVVLTADAFNPQVQIRTPLPSNTLVAVGRDCEGREADTACATITATRSGRHAVIVMGSSRDAAGAYTLLTMKRD